MEKSEQAFRTISEAAAELQLPQHVLRFWETRFAQIKPLKRGGGRRYYRPEDVLLLKGIRHLLYDQGFTIKGVQRILKDKGARHAIEIGAAGGIVETGDTAGSSSVVPVASAAGDKAAPHAEPAAPAGISPRARQRLSRVMRDLLECKRQLDLAREE